MLANPHKTSIRVRSPLDFIQHSQLTDESQLIPYYAHYQARAPEMWAGHTPTKEQVQALANAFTREWEAAVSEMLRHWEDPPVGDDDEE
jgi:hypothetical protein